MWPISSSFTSFVRPPLVGSCRLRAIHVDHNCPLSKGRLGTGSVGLGDEVAIKRVSRRLARRANGFTGHMSIKHCTGGLKCTICGPVVGNEVYRFCIGPSVGSSKRTRALQAGRHRGKRRER